MYGLTIQKRHDEIFLMLSNFEKHGKTQLLTKFQKKLYVGFRATLNFKLVLISMCNSSSEYHSRALAELHQISNMTFLSKTGKH